ncbi:MAG: methyltransferase [Alphaproteobacteria bacterium]|nr:methyltransferase [Alphaproteobacteria bacterium]
MPAEGDPLEHAEQLIERGRPDEAARFLGERIAAGRGGLLARLTLVRALLAAKDVNGALEAARETALLNPNVSQAVLALGEALLSAGHLPTAIAEFQRALRLDPASDTARQLLGKAWLEAGEAEKALEQFRAVETPDAALIARAEAVRDQQRSDAGYVRHLFDQFSADYDARMRGQLRYQAPEVLRELASMTMFGRGNLIALDLGCGTGLAAQAFADMTAAIDGIDLSPAMIAKARARGLYRDLKVADIETALDGGGADYDLILAADTLVYLGDLQATLSGVARRLRPNGFFLFTVELSAGPDFELGPKRRWRHSEAYLRRLAEAAGLDIAGLVTCSPRTEANVPVEGLAGAFSKPQ